MHAALFETRRYISGIILLSPRLPLERRVMLRSVVFIGLTYWVTNAIHFTIAPGSVAVGVYSLKMWPNLYGAWDAYTVRRFFGGVNA